ncbi:slipin family protein [Desulfogranum japonicum]|uniref:slipin family protein n=1 Tax=Desulfogranum japonicum TaxID=231447 RepID=UPI0003F8FCE6|nr:slipin family protein [Desulfogranum japonicum]
MRSYEKGLLFKDGEFVKILPEGKHWLFDVSGKSVVDVASTRTPQLLHKDLDLIVDSGLLGSDAKVLELSDTERGLVWVDNRFETILGPGQHVIWQGFKDVRIETVDTSDVKLYHPKIRVIIETGSAMGELTPYWVDEGSVGILFVDGVITDLLEPGCHAFWQNSGQVKVIPVDKGETTLDVSGQEILSRDKVSLRLNALVTYKVTDPVKAIRDVEDYKQSLYRETQLSLRATVGTMDIDTLLADRDALVDTIKATLSIRAAEFGLTVIGFGIRDIILPGDMKELLNKVVESKKMAEANLITRREETAAMRSQANSAKLLNDNSALMRLKELELLEKIAANSTLNILCGEAGLKDSVMKLI